MHISSLASNVKVHQTEDMNDLVDWYFWNTFVIAKLSLHWILFLSWIFYYSSSQVVTVSSIPQ